MTACASCGADVLPGSGFCRACGTAIVVDAPAVDVVAAPTIAVKRARPMGILVVAGASMAIGALGLLASLAMGIFGVFLMGGDGVGAYVLLGVAASWAAIAAGGAAWNGIPWGRLGVAIVLGLVAIVTLTGHIVSAVSYSPRALLSPWLIGSVGAGAFAIWYVQQPEARAWFAGAKKA